MKIKVALGIAFVGAFLFTFASTYFAKTIVNEGVIGSIYKEQGIVEQKIVHVDTTQKMHKVVYDKDKKIGVLTNDKELELLMDEAYEQLYKKDFPNTKLGLGEDIHVKEEVNYFTYENKDKEIADYIYNNNLFSVEANKIEFSNGEVIFVKNEEDYRKAQDEFVLNFVDKDVYEALRNKKELPELGEFEYGSRVVSAGFKETSSISKGLAPVDKIAKDSDEVLKILSYGYDAETKTYISKEFDTVQGIAWIHGITVNHLLSLNKDVLVGENQLIKVGTVLNVTPINSPIHFEVVMESQVQETVYPSETLIVYDDNLREGKEEIDTKQQLGLANAKYQETIINGKNIGEGKKISSIVTKQPVREVKRVGTKVYPHIGSGHFRWPVEVPSITCGWLCYSGHTANDVQNRYDFWGKVYASDRGTVVENGYTGINGYYMVIDHNNGYSTYYGHMARPGFHSVGTIVQQGEVIGDIGMTGFATGPHVHFEIRYHGRRLDPSTIVGK